MPLRVASALLTYESDSARRPIETVWLGRMPDHLREDVDLALTELPPGVLLMGFMDVFDNNVVHAFSSQAVQLDCFVQPALAMEAVGLIAEGNEWAVSEYLSATCSGHVESVHLLTATGLSETEKAFVMNYPPLNACAL